MQNYLKGAITIALVLISTLLSAQKNGEIQGQIHDETGDPVAYANIQLMGTSIGAISDDKGFYSIKNVPPGTYELRTTFVGYSDSQATVQVSAGGVTSQDFRLIVVSIQGEEVVVTAMARGQARAINNQIAANNIKNVVSEQKIRELPDANAAEALARLPGVSVIRSGGEAVAVKIRGVSSNTMYVNGMRLDGGLGSIASSMIGGIEVNKAFMADQEGDVLGGNVEFKMREALPGFRKDIWVKTGYNGFTNSFKMQDVSALLSNRFFNDRLGVMLGLNYDRKDRGRDILSASYITLAGAATGSEDVKPTYLSSVNMAHTENLNNRYGATLYTDFRLKSGKLFYQAFFSQLDAEEFTSSNQYNTTASLTYNSLYDHGLAKNFLQGVGGEHTLWGAKVEWSASMSNNRDETVDKMYYSSGNEAGMAAGISDITPSTSIDEFLTYATHDLYWTGSNSIYRYNQERYSAERDARLDVEVPFRMGKKIDGFLKFGGKVRGYERGYDNFQNGESFYHGHGEGGFIMTVQERLPDFGWVYLPNGYVAHGTFALEPHEREFSILEANTYFYPDFDKVEIVLDTMQDLLLQSMPGDAYDYTNRERYYAGYMMAGIDIGEYITLMPGIRYEQYDLTTTAKYVTLNGYGKLYKDQGSIRDTTAQNINDQILPMVHLKIKPTKWFDIRLAATKTLTRPGFTQLSPRYLTNDGTAVTTRGNPDLVPQTNYNYDIYFSFYTGKTGLFTIGAFYKKLVDQVFNYTVRILDPEAWGLSPAYQNKPYSYPKNNEWAGYVQGLEVDWQTHFSYLPKPFNGILLNMNLTYMQSETRYPFYSFSVVELPVYPYREYVGVDSSRVNKIIGMPDMIANVALGYELGGFAGRISAYYQSYTITRATSEKISLDQDKSALLRLDMQLSQKFKKVPGLVLYLNINNMTNNPDRTALTYYPDKIVRDERYGVSGDIGVRYKF
ncbi:MAG: TonB-dependent receptor [Bacteroidota bacterium]